MGLRVTRIALAAGLLTIGLVAASPFLTNRMVGTGEAYNYSLSVADAVTQMRAGIFPPLAGQTEFAFNGRIHPLRTAPYLHYLAYLIDLSTRRALPLWRLLTLSLALSIVAAVFACYLGLRWGIGCPRLLALGLSAVYGLSPSLLGAAYSFDLYMTVHAAVFVPLAIAACLRGCLLPSFSADAWLAAAISCAWLAHPPVAFWLTASVAFVRLIAFLAAPAWRTLARAACATVLAAGLCCFVFASATSLGLPLAGFSFGPEWRAVSMEILAIERAFFPASILPVTRFGGDGADLQFGYVAWVLLFVAAMGMVRTDGRKDLAVGSRRAAVAGCVLVTLLLLLLVLPVPGITGWIWNHIPPAVLNLTSIWPSQRLYLVAVPFALFGAAMVLPEACESGRVPRWACAAAAAFGLAWTSYQAAPFISHGMRDRWTIGDTRSTYRPSNLDLTETSYAFILPPSTWTNGVTDPAMEFRLLRNGTGEIASPLASGLKSAPAVGRGVIVLGQPSAVILMPGRRYLLTFAFHAPPANGFLKLAGPLLSRIYALPSAGGPRSFGMLPGERRTISLWTDGDRPEQVEIIFLVPAPKPGPGAPGVFADYTLQDVDPSALPIRFHGFLPLRFTVDAPEMGSTVETPQRYLPGYEARVNGVAAPVLSSPEGQVMVPVPRGRSEVEVTYRGPLPARIAFWLCAACWTGFIAWRLCGSRLPLPPHSLVAEGVRFGRRHFVLAASGAACALALAFGAMRLERFLSRRNAVGPIEVDFRLPYGALGINEPLLVTGQINAGVVVFFTCLDSSHIRLGADVWGQLFQSDPIETDFSKEQELVVSDSALFPQDNPRVRELGPHEAERLRGILSVELNGRPAIRADCYAYETSPDEILAGMTHFGSNAVSRSHGTILGLRRLAIPRQVVVPWGRRVHLDLRFPTNHVGDSEPLVTAIWPGATQSLYVTYLSKTRIQLSEESRDGVCLRSPEVAVDPARSHAIDIDAGVSADRTQATCLACSLDGKPLLGDFPVHSPDSPPWVVAGVNSAETQGVNERFTGGQLDLAILSKNPAPRVPYETGPVHMIVTFPAGKNGRAEPLLTTGQTGAGDLLYVSYSDSDHVRIALDHWGSKFVMSRPIPVDYKSLHEIWINMASLVPPSTRVSGMPVAVMLDGAIVLSSPIVPYPSAPSDVTIAENRIHGSNDDPAFTGVVHFVERMGPAAIPQPRS